MKKNLKIFSVYALCFFLSGCDSKELKLIKETRFLMGTLFDITVSHHDVKKSRKAIEKAFNEIQRIELLTSKYITKSEIAKINRHAGRKSYRISSELYELLQKSVYYSQLSSGTFDITVGVIQDLWNFDNEKGEVPSRENLLRFLPLVDYKSILLENDYHVRLKKTGMKLDLGAIAKGYAVDRGIKALRQENINNAILNGGGDLIVIGEKSPGLPWKVGVRHPRKPSEIIASLEKNNIAIATSGDYQKYFIKDGKRFHHLLDPATGMPSQGLQSVTIITESAVLADAMSTAVFIMGAERGLKFIESQNKLEGFLIAEDGTKIISSGLKGEIKIHDSD